MGEKGYFLELHNLLLYFNKIKKKILFIRYKSYRCEKHLILNQDYSELSQRHTPLGPTPTVRRREVSGFIIESRGDMTPVILRWYMYKAKSVHIEYTSLLSLLKSTHLFITVNNLLLHKIWKVQYPCCHNLFSNCIPVFKYYSLQKLPFTVSIDDLKVSVICLREVSIL